MTKMKVYLLRITVALLTFTAGVAAVAVWLALQALPVTKSEALTFPRTNNSNQTVTVVSCPGRAPISSYRSYRKVVATLREFVEREGNLKRNTLYISPIEHERDTAVAFVYWKEKESILLLNLDGEKIDCNWPQPNENNSSMLEPTIEDCVLNGQRLILNRTRR